MSGLPDRGFESHPLRHLSLLMMNDIKYWNAFNRVPGIGRVKISLLEKYFGILEKAWFATFIELREAGLDTKAVDAIITNRKDISPEQELEKLLKLNIKVLSWNDEEYPGRLKEVDDKPPVLYVKGDLISEDKWSIAVVGTRRATVYGRQVTEEIVNNLSRRKITIISGLARGIDTVAHKAALDAGGRTIAVFGCGLDMVYPADNLNLARRICECGALVSEYPLGTRPRADNFPRRNRIMSGMSLGVLVIEASERSGALITAHQALEQNREVFAIPGSILSPASCGTNRLIQEGAKLVLNYNDVLEELNLCITEQQMEMRKFVSVTDTENMVLECLSGETTHIDEICRRTELPISTVSSLLSIMELRGIVKQLGGMQYIINKEVSYTDSSR